MVTVSRRFGKLIAIRVASPVTYREATTLKPRVEALMGPMSAPVYVVADLSDARVYSPDVAEKILGALRCNCPTVHRLGILVNPSSALGGQLFQAFREAGDHARQAWVQPDGLCQHLGEVLGPGERDALREFLAEGSVDAHAGV